MSSLEHPLYDEATIAAHDHVQMDQSMSRDEQHGGMGEDYPRAVPHMMRSTVHKWENHQTLALVSVYASETVLHAVLTWVG